MSYEMKAKADFTNPRIQGPRGDGSVLEGETFSTDWLHAKELVANKLAEPSEPGALDREPTDAVAAHHGLSVGAHAEINKRRAGAGGDRKDAAAAALERVQAAKSALDEAEKAAKDKPSTAAKTRLDAAQAEYDAAESEAKAFT